MENSSFRAVILDMDGLMLDTEMVAREAWRGAARTLGYELSESRYLELVGRRDDDCERELVGWFGEAFPLEAFRRVCDARWHELTADVMPTKPGLAQLLDWIERERIPWAVATSSLHARALAKIEKAGLDTRIPCLVAGDHVRAAKPAPDIYLEAARQLGVPPADCVAVEDSDAGVGAAYAASMRVIMVPDLKAPSELSLTRAWRVCQTLHDVIDVLSAERQRHVPL